MDECPSCGGEMEERRARTITLTLVGTEGGEDEDELLDDGDADLISWVCVDCGYKEEAEYRGDEDGDEEEQE
jgi:ssDNA-binding Zn-finger/Zn-ribbon topoisomerase 1